MNIDKLGPFRPVPRIIVPSGAIKNKHWALIHFSENEQLSDVYNFLNIKPNAVHHVLIPSTKIPMTHLTPAITKTFMNHRLQAHKFNFGDFSRFTNVNFYLDTSIYMTAANKKWNFTKFNNGRGSKFVKQLLTSVGNIPKDTHNTALLYTINLHGSIGHNLFLKRVYAVYDMIIDGTFPFDQLICFYHTENEGRYIKLWDKDLNMSHSRLRSFLMKLESTDPDLFTDQLEDKIAENVVDAVIKPEIISQSVVVKNDLPNNVTLTTQTVNQGQKTVDNNKKDELKSAIKTYLKVDSSLRNKLPHEIDHHELAAKAVVYHMTGDIDRTKKIVNKMPIERRKQVVKMHSDKLLRKDDAVNTAESLVVKLSNVVNLIDNIVPAHILEKRKTDFEGNLDNDMNSIFRILENKQIPLKLKSIHKKVIKSPPSELLPSIKNEYKIELTDPENNIHNIRVELPHLTDNNTFLINGRHRIIINQLITYPIFFFKPFYGQLSTVYAAITVHSKQIKSGNYLIGHIGGYKIPLILLMSYYKGFDETCKQFGIHTEIHKEKPNVDLKDENIMVLKLSSDSYIEIHVKDEVGRQLMYGLKYMISSLPPSDVFDKELWKRTLVSFTGTRNSIYRVDEVLNNIITPIEIEVLSAHGDPTKLEGILKYISDNVVSGKVDDRNSLDKQRIRTSEIFTALISNQINASYNEYLGKKLGGDKDARLSLNATKVFSDVITSQNVQLLEGINPMEEISMMTRITPVGIGGIPDSRAISNTAMNIHHTYFGNIDPLETPDGANVGIVQHLSMGSALINNRGQFAIRDHSKIYPSEILSAGPASIPFVNSTDGNRILMAAGQMKQSIPLIDPEVPAVQTGYESVIPNLLSDNFVKKAPVDGEVIYIGKDFIRIKKDENTFPVDISPRLLKSGQGKNGISIFKATVAVGQKVKKGQIIAEGGGVVRGQIATGRNLLIAIMPWKGYNFEDGVVMSESAAAKFTSQHISEESTYIPEENDVVFMAQEGDVIKKGGILLSHTSSTSDVESYTHLRSEGGTITNIEIYSNLGVIPEKLKVMYTKFKKRFEANHEGKYPQGTFKEKSVKFEGILIKFILKQELHLNKGDKINNRHFNKGVVAIIEPDSNMPLTPWGDRIEMVLNPISFINRMNNGQLLECHTGLICWKMGQLAKKQDRTQFTDTILKVLTLMDGTDKKEYVRPFIQKLRSLSDPAYKKFIEDIVDHRFFPIIIPPFKNPPKENIEKAAKIVGLDLRYYLDIPGFGKSLQPVTVGFILENKLEHTSDKKLASRSSGSYVAKTKSPTQGKKREGGQKIGENDLYALLSWDCPTVIEEFFGALSSDHATKNAIIAEIINTGHGTFQQPKSNPVKDLLSNYFMAIHLKSD